MSEFSWQDFYNLGRVTLQTRRPSLIVEEGDATDAIIAGTATIGTAIIANAASEVRACFLDGAQQEKLVNLAHDRGVEKNLGSRAIGTIVLTRPSSAGGAGTILAGRRVATEADDTGAFAIFTTDIDVVWGSELTKSVTGTASSVGKSGNIAVGSLTRFLDPIFDTTIVPSNPARFAGGTEEEADEDLRDRVRNFFLTQSRGTVAALNFGAREVPGVERVSVAVDASGVVTVYVADADGNSNAAMVAAVTAELENWRDAADVIYVTAGFITSVTIILQITVRTGVSIDALLDRIRQSVISAVGRLNPGESLYRDLVETAAKDVDREGIITANMISPAVTIVPAANELIRTAVGLITFT
jgi:hypothetical protein